MCRFMQSITATVGTAAILVATGCTNQAVPATPASDNAPPANSEQLLADMERENSARWKARDAAYFDRILHDAVLMNLKDGTLQSKQAYLADLAKPYRVDRTDSSDLTIRIHGTTAIVTGVSHNAGEFDGKLFDSKYRYFDTFVWTGTEWKCVAWAMVPLQQ